jgi:hypothetical protein
MFTTHETRSSVRPSRWLSKLETALKSRVGWWDEAVSPFAKAQHNAKPVASRAGPEPLLQPMLADVIEPVAKVPANEDRPSVAA